MPSRCQRAALALAGALCATTSLSALDANKWCVVQNNSGRGLAITITDTVATLGVLRVKSADGTEAELKNNKGSAVVAPGRNMIYFDTTAKMFAAHFKIGDTSFHCDIGTDEDFEITAPSLSQSGVLINPAAFRNLAGGTFLTLTK